MNVMGMALTAAAGDTVGNVIEQAGTVITATLGWVTDVTSTIMGSGFLFVTTGILLLGAAVGIMGRLLSRN